MLKYENNADAKGGFTDMYEMIGSPVLLGGLQLKNRIIFAPTTPGPPREEVFEKLEAVACGAAP